MRWHGLAAWLGASVMVSAMIGGCAASTATTRTATGPLALPEGWSEIDITMPGIQAQVEALEATDPGLAYVMDEWRSLPSLRLRAPMFGAIGRDGPRVVGFVGVIKDDIHPLGSTLQELEPMHQFNLALEGLEGEIGRIKIPAGEALRVVVPDYQRPRDVQALHARIYLLPVDDTVWKIVFTCRADMAQSCEANAEAMVRTFQIPP